LRLLGSGGFMPTDRRETACTLLREGNAALLIDAGSGVRRLVDEPELLDGVERLHICLTHFHLDHVIGLFYVGELELPIELWGGGEALEGIPTRELVARLLGSPFAPSSFVGLFADVHELREGDQDVGPFRVRARQQLLHSNPTLALRIGDELAVCTDTSYDEANVDFVRGVRVLLHDAFESGDTAEQVGHSAAGEAARIASGAGVERLVLIHVNPGQAPDEDLAAFARPHFARTDVGSDGFEL
jgi:ribonuclease BN (tRNA processing enzyme)